MVQKALNNTSVSMNHSVPEAVLKHSHTSERENRDLCIDRDQSKGIDGAKQIRNICLRRRLARCAKLSRSAVLTSIAAAH